MTCKDERGSSSSTVPCHSALRWPRLHLVHYSGASDSSQTLLETIRQRWRPIIAPGARRRSSGGRSVSHSLSPAHQPRAHVSCHGILISRHVLVLTDSV